MYDIIFPIAMIGVVCASAWTSYKIGRKDGATALLEILQHQKIIAYDNKGNVKPNQFYIEED